ncbi:MAG: arginine deiminase family protein [Candidatus Thermoplasmatota archaeon]|nr:arginine deiminase family protein [Candidatus Thermoplasmatota archaeon]
MSVRTEWNNLREVIMHRPGVEIDYAMLAPKPFLFERPYKTTMAVKEHEKLERYLKEAGVRVKLLKDVVMDMFESSGKFREIFLDKILKIVRYEGDKESVAREEKAFRDNISVLDSSTLFNLMLIEPSVLLKSEGENGPDYPSVNSNLPLANLYFMRDQQAVSNGGIFFGRMRMRQRQKENSITEFILRSVYENREQFKSINGSGYFEGGDFMPAGDYAIIGTGSRSDLDGALAFINSGISSAKEFLVVENPIYDFMEKEPRDQMINMHLDTYFNFVSKDAVVTSPVLAKKAKGTIYSHSDGVPKKVSTTTLSAYLKSKGVEIIPLSIAEQLSYSSNFLTLKENHLLAVDSSKVLRKLISQNVFSPSTLAAIDHVMNVEDGSNMFPRSRAAKDYGLDFVTANLSELTGGYGGAHCMTASIIRG